MALETLIIVLNYRTADLTIQCLKSLAQEISIAKNRVLVIDNHSNDASEERIQMAIKENGWSHWASLTVLQENRGYAAGNNVGFKMAMLLSETPKYIWILNSDTIVLKGAIQALVDFMDAHPDAGIAGSQLEEPEGRLQHSSFRFPSIFSELDHAFRFGLFSRLLSRWRINKDISNEAQRTDWIAGASFFIRTSIIEDIGLIDEEYFLYYEEVDFCLKAYRAEWECWCVPQSRVIHLVGQSTQISRPEQHHKRLPDYWFRSRRRYFQKNHGWLYALITDLGWMMGFGIWRIRRLLQRKPDTDPPYMLWDFFLHSSLFHRHRFLKDLSR